ncbi:glycosyltransferase family 4 protein [Cohnella caldifontis]|uniref:glycosyltransferase family 4 protein n=1 Tax=Cohnella caldifontis TaxID=3027471 RepID=UPI0023EAC5FC|nr:glycosyltransferase family 4 protein [Cohnella sp. YIM B05605]
MFKVAHLCTSSNSHKVLVDKLALLARRGYRIHLISSAEGYDERLMGQYPLPMTFVPMHRKIRPLQDFLSIIRLMRLFRKEKYDIVHTHTAKAGLVGRIAARLAGIPVVIHTAHGLPFYEGQGKIAHFVYRMLEKLASAFCDAIASQNREDLEKIRAYAPRQLVFYEGNGVDLERLDRRRASITEEELDRIRAAWRISPGRKVILVGARLEPVKDHFFLLRGIHRLVQEGCADFVCLLAGKGPLEAEIRSRIAALGLEDHVKIVGHQTDIYPYVQLADAVALTSEKEGLPRILMEGMAYSKPVIASDVLGTRELLRHGLTGLLVPPQDEGRLAAAFRQVLENETFADSLGRNAREAIERDFTEDAVIRRIEHYYHRLYREKTPVGFMPEYTRQSE